MKIAITGGLGFVGKWILKSLNDSDEAIILTRNDVSSVIINNRTFRCYSTDYSVDSLDKILSGCDALIHLAAQRQISKNNNICINNILIDFNTFTACKNHSINNIIYSSSRSVYIGNEILPWRENLSLEPKSLYGLSKELGEKIAIFFNDNNKINIKSLRLSQVFGLGEIDAGVTTVFLKKAYNKENILLSVGGNIKREYIYVKDLTDAILTALNYKDVSGIFNLGSGDLCSIEDLALYINKAFDNSGNLSYSENMKILNEYSLMDSSLFYKTFDWKPKYTIKEAIVDIKDSLDDVKLAKEYGYIGEANG